MAGILNTHLLHAYSKLDARVSPLVMYVKNWAKSNNINSPYNKTLSSLSLTLMCIHYLQTCNPPVLPSLQKLYPQIFDGNPYQILDLLDSNCYNGVNNLYLIND